jgi:hypothetical protein
MHGLATLVLENLQAIGASRYPLYEAMLAHACEAAPPPFAENWFGRRYFELARRADWFANSLIANAALEGYGSVQIWAFSNKLDNEAYAGSVRRHSLDESRHSTMFVKMLPLVFPNAAVDDSTRRTIDALQPRFSKHSHPSIEKVPEHERFSHDRMLQELVGIQFTEIRALILQFLLRSAVLAYSGEASRKRLEAFTSVLIRDESRHIDYVARIIESEASAGHADLLFELFEQCLRRFNEVTMIELERDKVAI